MDQRRRRGEGLGRPHLVPPETDARREVEEQLGVGLGAREFSRFLLVDRFREPPPFLQIRAARVKRGDRPRELDDLEEELLVSNSPNSRAVSAMTKSLYSMRTTASRGSRATSSVSARSRYPPSLDSSVTLTL